MALFLSPIKKEIRNTLEKRQNNAPTDKYGWFNSKTTWLRITSMAQVGDDKDLRLDWILFGGLIDNSKTNKLRSGYENIYDQNTNRPMPGVTGLSVQNKGSMGSTRESTFNYTCWDVNQLNILEQLYMTPGISILIEFGWNKDIDNNNILYNVSELPPMYDKCATKDIIRNVADSGGHYDGMQGVVSDFSWSLRPDGGFDCSTTIVSMAEMFLEMETHSTSKGITKKTVDNEGSKSDTENALEENIVATITTTAKLLDEKKLKLDNRNMGWITEMEQSSGNEDDFIDWNGEQIYWIKWEYFEKIILNGNLFFTSSTTTNDCPHTKKEAVIGALTDFSNWLKHDNKKGKKITTPTLDNDDLLINHNPYIISGDPSVCILPFKTFGDTDITFTDKGYIYDTKTVLPDDLVSKKIGTNNNYKFPFKDILLNLKFIYQAYKKTTSLNKFLMELLSGINDACGNYWDFGIQIDEDDPTRISIVDYKTIASDTINPFMFKAMKINSILKSVDISTEVSEKIKSVMMLGANTKKNDKGINKSAGTESNSGYNFYGENITNLSAPQLEFQPATEEDVGGDIDNFSATDWTIDNYINNIETNLKIVYSNPGYFGGDGVTNENVTALKRALAKFVADVSIIPNDYNYQPNKGKQATIRRKHGNSLHSPSKITKPSSDKNYTIIPLKLNFTLDGIGGLKFGNVIQIDYLPDRYLKHCYFQITNVSHDLTQTEWTTSVETIMRVNMNEISQIEMKDTTSFKKNTTSNSGSRIINQPENINLKDTWSKTTNYRITLLHPMIRNHAKILINECERQGMKVGIGSGFRTSSEQTALYAKGRTTTPKGRIVTKAKAGSSYHNYGLAVDLYENIKGNEYDNINKIVKIAKILGWEWGTDIFNFKDDPHFQMTFNHDIKMLKAKVKAKQVDSNGYVKL